MIKKIVITAAVAVAAIAFAPTASYAKKAHKSHVQKCTAGHMATGQANKFGWAPVSSCGLDCKMYPLPAMCYTASGLCPKG
jgi:hypothetical protein